MLINLDFRKKWLIIQRGIFRSRLTIRQTRAYKENKAYEDLNWLQSEEKAAYETLKKQNKVK